jgi:hypothetical protein
MWSLSIRILLLQFSVSSPIIYSVILSKPDELYFYDENEQELLRKLSERLNPSYVNLLFAVSIILNFTH